MSRSARSSSAPCLSWPATRWSWTAWSWTARGAVRLRFAGRPDAFFQRVSLATRLVSTLAERAGEARCAGRALGIAGVAERPGSPVRPARWATARYAAPGRTALGRAGQSERPVRRCSEPDVQDRCAGRAPGAAGRPGFAGSAGPRRARPRAQDTHPTRERAAPGEPSRGRPNYVRPACRTGASRPTPASPCRGCRLSAGCPARSARAARTPSRSGGPVSGTGRRSSPCPPAPRR